MKRTLLLALLLGGCAASQSDWAGPPKTDLAQNASVLGGEAQSDLYLGVVDGLIRQQRYQAAIAFLAKYQKSGPATPRFCILAGQALTGAARYDEAIASFRCALKSESAALAYDGIGQAQAARGDWASAVQNFRTATLLDPANADYLNNLGYAQLRQPVPEYAAAADALERAYELAPDSVRIRNNLALADQRSGRTTKLHTLLDNIADPVRRKLVADFATHANTTGLQP